MSEGAKASPHRGGFRFRVRGPRDFYGGLVLIALAIIALWVSGDLPGQQGWLTRFHVDYKTHEWTVEAVWPGLEAEPRAGFLDRKPSKLCVFVAEHGRLAATPLGNDEEVVRRLTMQTRLGFTNGSRRDELKWGEPDLFLGLADKCLLDCFTGLDVPTDHVPAVWRARFM